MGDKRKCSGLPGALSISFLQLKIPVSHCPPPRGDRSGARASPKPAPAQQGWVPEDLGPVSLKPWLGVEGQGCGCLSLVSPRCMAGWRVPGGVGVPEIGVKGAAGPTGEWVGKGEPTLVPACYDLSPPDTQAGILVGVCPCPALPVICELRTDTALHQNQLRKVSQVLGRDWRCWPQPVGVLCGGGGQGQSLSSFFRGEDRFPTWFQQNQPMLTERPESPHALETP